MKRMFGIVILALACGCSRPTATAEFLGQQGYRQIQITGWRPFMASDKDVFSTGFEAVNSYGMKVTGAVTEGWFKGRTIRFD